MSGPPPTPNNSPQKRDLPLLTSPDFRTSPAFTRRLAVAATGCGFVVVVVDCWPRGDGDRRVEQPSRRWGGRERAEGP